MAKVSRTLKGTEEEREAIFSESKVKLVSVLKNGYCEVVFFSEDESEIPKVSTLSEMTQLLKGKLHEYGFSFDMDKKEVVPDNDSVVYVPYSIFKYGTNEVVYTSHFLYFHEDEGMKLDPFDELRKVGFTAEVVLDAIRGNKDTILGSMSLDDMPDMSELDFID